jgi:hypothetical protein
MAVSNEKADSEPAAAGFRGQLATRLAVLRHDDGEIALVADETAGVSARRTRNGRTPC